MDTTYDVAIIGGGPSGSTAATFLARQGHKVVVLERDKFPRFHIGESLLPHSAEALKRLGLEDKMDEMFLPKYGAEISTVCGTNVAQILFKNGLVPGATKAWQVTRSEFDKLLLDNATTNGAEVREQTSVESIDFQPDEVRLKIKNADGTQELRSRYLLDCSGRGSMVGQHFKLKRNYHNLKKFSVFAHFENVTRAEGIEGSFIRIITGKDRWFWMIPLTPTKMSIGFVMDITTFKGLKQSPEDALDQAMREQPLIWKCMTNATRVTIVHSASDYSYRNTSLVGERWMLAGDAAGFIDPVFSTGVCLGMRSGEEAADALHIALTRPSGRAEAFNKYEQGVNRVMDLYLKFVSHWYQPQFAEVITNPTDHFKLVQTVTTVLAGNLANTFSIWWRMQVFYLIVFLQRFIPVCPRVPLVPDPQWKGEGTLGVAIPG